MPETQHQNTLYWGDCLKVMGKYMDDESVDLIYLDPPFNSNKDYNAIYKLRGLPIPEHAIAFEDTWKMTKATEKFLRNLPKIMAEKGYDRDNTTLLKHFLDALRKPDLKMCSYLTYMTQRLIDMKRVLKPTGSIYLHCDPTASHYLKIMMDVIFGKKNFRNEIIWRKYGGRKNNAKRKFSTQNDVILFYVKSEDAFFRRFVILHSDKEIKKEYKYKDEEGRQYRLSRGRSYQKTGKQKKIYLDESPGRFIGNLWIEDGLQLNTSSKERLGYPTQKPLKLLDRIIKASSKEGDIVFDPFCGCATTIEAAHRLKRKWIGIDIGVHSIKSVSKKRLEDKLSLKNKKDYKLSGWPLTHEGAEALWKEDTYLFQKWAIESVDGFCTPKKTGDGGIDGDLFFRYANKDWHSMVIEVKGGRNVNAENLRSLIGVLGKEQKTSTIVLGGLIVLHPLGERKMRNWQTEIDALGTYKDSQNNEYPKIQILTVQEILDEKRFKIPRLDTDEGGKKGRAFL